MILGGGLLVLFSLGLAYPYLKARLVRFAAGNHAYGAAQIEIGDITAAFYGVYLKAFGLLILCFGLAGAIAGLTGAYKGMSGGFSVGMGVFMVAAYAGYLLAYAYVHAKSTNVTWNAMTMGPLSFACALRGRDLAAIYLVNIIAVILTLGLATPWAAVRTMRYRASKMTLVAAGSLGDFVANEAGNVSATGEEVGEMFGIDFGL